MSAVSQPRATLDDLYREPGKAELIGGRIVRYMASGFKANCVAGRISRSLDDYAEGTKQGVASGHCMVFAIPLLPSGRESFSPDAAYYVGPLPKNAMQFIEGPPTFAVEVRSENDYGPAAEANMARKRADYFAAGTLVVWDVDLAQEIIHVYRSDTPDRATTYRRGQSAEAEPAVPGWVAFVHWIFRKPTGS